MSGHDAEPEEPWVSDLRAFMAGQEAGMKEAYRRVANHLFDAARKIPFEEDTKFVLREFGRAFKKAAKGCKYPK